MRPNISGEIKSGPVIQAKLQKPLASLAATTVGQMATRIGIEIGINLALALVLGLAWAQQQQLGGGDLEMDYSNEYDDVRPHLVYPDDPRLDKRLGQAAQEFGQNISQAWQSMVDSFKDYFEELKNLFAADPNAANEVVSAH